jgi:hypothetical protein
MPGAPRGAVNDDVVRPAEMTTPAMIAMIR